MRGGTPGCSEKKSDISDGFERKRQNNPDLPNLKLNTVAEHYLGENKVDLPPKEMFRQFEQGSTGIYRVAQYCCQDCLLVLNLAEKLGIFTELLEMAKVTRTIPEDLLYRGQQIKVYTQLLAAAHVGHEFVVQDAPFENDMPCDLGTAEIEAALDKYKGAHVEDPTIGYFTDPVITVDFASL